MSALSALPIRAVWRLWICLRALIAGLGASAANEADCLPSWDRCPGCASDYLHLIQRLRPPGPTIADRPDSGIYACLDCGFTEIREEQAAEQ